MGLWERVKSAISRAPRDRSDPLRLLSSQMSTNFGVGRGYSARGSTEALELYATSPWLRAVSGLVGKTVASHGWRAYRMPDKQGSFSRFARSYRTAAPLERRRMLTRAIKTGDYEEIEAHPLLELIDRPNALIDGRVSRQSSIISYDLAGDFAWVVVRGTLGTPSAFYPVPGPWITRLPSVEQPTYRVRMSGVEYEVPATDVIFVVDPNPLNPYGRGAGLGVAMGDELDIDEFAAKTVSAWFQNRAMPDAVVSIKNASPTTIRQSQEQWNALTQGFAKAWRTMFVPGELEVKRMDTTFAEQQLIELRKHGRDTVQQIFGVPPEQLGIIANSNRATSEAAEAHGARNVQIPRLETLRAAYQQLADMFDDRIIVEYDDPIPPDVQQRLTAMTSLQGRATIDEEREIMGLPPLPNGVGQGFMVPAGTSYVRSQADIVPPFQQPQQTMLSAVPVTRQLQARAVDLSVPETVRDEAARGLRWVDEFRRGGTTVGRTTARMLVDGRMTEQRVRRMARYFPRHEVDSQADGWSPGEDGYPSNGRIAWALWGGDAGRAWSEKIVRQLDREESQSKKREFSNRDISRLLAAIDKAGADEILLPAIEELMQIFGDETLQELAETVGTIPAENIDMQSDAIQKQLDEARERLSRLINKTTKSDLRDLLRESIDAELSDDEIKAEVVDFFDRAKAERSATIAETEAVTHANFAGIEALEQSGVAGIQKEWIATPDGRTRPEHMELDGQQQDLRTPFVVQSGPYAGAKANHPGGFAGIAELNVNCRCATGTVIPELRSAALVTRGIALPAQSTREERIAYWRARDERIKPLEADLKSAVEEMFDLQLEAVLAAI